MISQRSPPYFPHLPDKEEEKYKDGDDVDDNEQVESSPKEVIKDPQSKEVSQDKSNAVDKEHSLETPQYDKGTRALEKFSAVP